MPIRIPLNLLTHDQKIAALYKKWLRILQVKAKSLEDYRYKAVLARQDFDCMLYEKDKRKSKEMLLQKEQELAKERIEPIHFFDDPKGVGYQREYHPKDHMLDLWHPLEKAIFPDYFAKRELRKQQYIEMWEKQHGPPPPSEDK